MLIQCQSEWKVPNATLHWLNTEILISKGGGAACSPEENEPSLDLLRQTVLEIFQLQITESVRITTRKLKVDSEKCPYHE